MGRRKTVGLGYDKAQKVSPWYIRINGVKTYYPTQKERDDAHTSKQAEVEAFGFDHAGSMSISDRLAIAEMRRAATRLHLEPMEVFRRGLASIKESPGMPLQEAIDSYLAHCKARVGQQTMRRLTWKDLGRILNHFSAHCGQLSVSEVTRSMVDTFSLGAGPAANSQANRVSRVSMLFSWLVTKGVIKSNPCKRPQVPRKTPTIYDIELVRRIMRTAERQHPRIVPMLALQWFAGMRPHATQRIEWKHVDFRRRRIIIPAELSKSTEPEIVDRLPSAVWAWLKAYRRRSGRIAPYKHVAPYIAVKRACGIQRWPADVARHTFASHLYGMTDSIEEVARALLHHTTRITLKHYVAKGISQAEGRAYFSSRPQRPARSPRRPQG